MTQHARIRRLLGAFGAMCWLVVAATSVPALAHPSGLYAPGSSPCDPRDLGDAAAYAGLAALATFSVLAALRLPRPGTSTAWAIGGIAVVVLGFATRGTASFGCPSHGLVEDPGSGSASVVLGLVATGAVLLVWHRPWRRPAR